MPTPLVLLVVIGILDWLSLVIILVVLAVAPVFMILVGRMTEQRVIRRWEALTTLGAHFLDTLQILPTLRAYGRPERQETQIADVAEELRRTTLAVLREAFLSALVLETLAAVGTALVAVPLALRLISGQINLASALAVVMLTPEVFLALRLRSPRVVRAAGHLRVAGVLSGPARLGPAGRRADPRARGRVALGTGKSTLLGASVGLLAPQFGSVSVGSVVQSQVEGELWRRNFAFVPRRPHLFSGTLADNIRLGFRPADDDHDRLAAAVEVAQLDELLALLSLGLSGPRRKSREGLEES
ncbi:MAG: ABC transporter transmembrane domain-containing protein [Solirubrobacteraceae bacterium]